MHCNVRSVSNVDHAILPQREIELVGEAASLSGILLRISFSFICPSCHPYSPGFVFYFLISDFGPSLVYMLVRVSPKAESEPGVYLAGVSDLVKRITKGRQTTKCLMKPATSEGSWLMTLQGNLGNSATHMPQHYPSPKEGAGVFIYIPILDSLWLRATSKG